MNKLMTECYEIIHWPKKPSEKEIVIQFLSNKFEYDKKYSEKEVNKIINKFHLFNDIALLRRELVSRKFLSRKDYGSEYWKV